jgi:hypothetical protein
METNEQEIIKAIEEVKEAMLENLRAGKAEEQAMIAKEQAHYKLLKAKERLNALERGL